MLMKGLKMKAQIQSVEYVTVLFAVKSTELIMSKDTVTPTSAQGSLKKKKKEVQKMYIETHSFQKVVEIFA